MALWNHASISDGRGRRRSRTLIGAVSLTLLTSALSAQTNWIRRTPATSPPGRYSHAMAYDAARGRVVLFGGAGIPGLFSDTWEWEGTNWTQRTPANRPSARYAHGMAYDAARQRVVLLGGRGSSPMPMETWEWDGTDWTQRTPASNPPPRGALGIAYDAARQRVVLFGGTTDFGIYLSDTWQWDGTDWTERTPANAPAGRRSHAMAYDAARQRVVVFGGTGEGPALSDTWEWDGTNWTQRTPAVAPTARAAHVLAHDARGLLVLFGGSYLSPLSDTWEWDGTAWAPRIPPVGPSARFTHAMACDTARGRVVLFGGSEQGNPLLSDTWEYAATCDGVAGPEFGNPAPVAELRMPGSYGVSPTVDARQHDIWWISNRPGGLGGSDVWHASRASVSAPWSGIQNVPELNSSGGENSVSVRGDGRVIYFSSTRPGGPVGEKLWQSSRDPGGPWTPPTLVPGVNLSTYQGGPSVSPDGQELFFSSNGPGSLGLNAIWTSTFNPQTSAWNPPTRIAELDSAFNEYSPALSADGKRLYFTSNRPGGTGGYDIYVACRAARGQPWNLWRPASELESASDDWSSCETPDGYSQYLVRDADVHRADRFFPRLVGPTSGPTPGVATFLLRRNPGNLGVIAIGVDALPPTSVPPILGDLLMIPLVLLANSVHDADGNVTLMLPIASAPGAIVRFQGMSQDLATGLYYLSNRIDFLLR